MLLRHVSSGMAERQRTFLRTLALITVFLGTFFSGINLWLGAPFLSLLEGVLAVLSLFILIRFNHSAFVERAKWLLLCGFFVTELFAFFNAPSPSVYIWAFLVLPIAHRLLGLRSGSIVSVAVLCCAAGILVLRYGPAEVLTHSAAVADFVGFAIVLFFSSYAHERDIQKADRQIRARADIDALTHLATRPRFYEMFESAREQARRGSRQGRGRQQVTIILIDLDHFKEINDSYGHLAGDRVLSTVARRLLNQCRQDDLLGRIGGEELAMVLFGGTHGAAVQRAERLRRAIADSPVVTSDAEVPVTASFGVATHELANTSFDALFEEADMRLYKAKAAGRNRVQGESVS